MDVKEATATAEKHLSEAYADEQVTSLGLEEVQHIPAVGLLCERRMQPNDTGGRR